MARNPFVAEAGALRDGLQLAWDKGYMWIECEIDSLDLVQAVEDEDLGRFNLCQRFVRLRSCSKDTDVVPCGVLIGKQTVSWISLPSQPSLIQGFVL